MPRRSGGLNPGASLPRSLAVRPTITVELYPAELSRLIGWLERDAAENAQDPDREAFADFLFQRVAVLREAMR